MAIMGNKDIMSAVQDSFISSYWTEKQDMLLD